MLLFSLICIAWTCLFLNWVFKHFLARKSLKTEGKNSAAEREAVPTNRQIGTLLVGAMVPSNVRHLQE